MTVRSYAADRVALENGETSCQELVSYFLEQIRQHNEAINAFINVDSEGAIEQARKLDSEWTAGRRPALAGMVIGVKDVICIKNQPVTCSSKMLSNFTSLYDATVIQRLRDAGAIFIGKLNSDEFAMGSSNENSFYGVVRNPVDTRYVPGGSSGGSAAAVAAGMCHVALGTDTGGSIRLPAAFCGVYGLKPTYGRVSRHGLVAFASSFDCIGPIANTASDLALVLQEMAGKDTWDATSSSAPVEQYLPNVGASLSGARIGLPEEYFSSELDSEIAKALDDRVQLFRALGATIVPVSLPHTEFGIAAYYVLTMAEASSNLARYDGVRYGYRSEPNGQARIGNTRTTTSHPLSEFYEQNRTEGFGDEVKRRIMLGTYVLSAGYYDEYYSKAQKVRRLIKQDFDLVFEQVEALLTPAASTTAFKLGSKTSDPLSMYLTDIYTVTANLAGIPGISFPAAKHSNGLPIGLQLLGPAFSEQRLLKLASDAGESTE